MSEDVLFNIVAIVVGGGAGLVCKRAMTTGEIRVGSAGHSRVISRKESPAEFRIAVGIIGVIGTGFFTLGVLRLLGVF